MGAFRCSLGGPSLGTAPPHRRRGFADGTPATRPWSGAVRDRGPGRDHPRPALGGVLDGHGPAMGPDQSVDEIQAESRATALTGRPELGERTLPDLRRDAVARVVNL